MCTTMRKSPSFFKTVDQDKQKVIRSMCRRLREAEMAERQSYDYAYNQEPASKLWFLVLGAGIALIWYYRIKDGSPIQSYCKCS